MEISHINPESLSDKNITDMSILAALAFGRSGVRGMQADTARHIAASDSVQIATDRGRMIGFSMMRRDGYGSNLELAGRAVHPHYQRDGVASRMLDDLILRENPDTLTTFTRNPHIVRMLAKKCMSIYPLSSDTDLEEIAIRLGDRMGSAVYHMNRYGEAGLYGDNDPARGPFGANGESFAQYFPYLHDPSNALVVVGRVNGKSGGC